MRSYLLSSACAASMLLALTPAAQAADIAPEPPGWSWYVSVFGGYSIPDDVDVSFYNSGYDYEAEIDLDDGFMAGAALGGQFNEWLRGEIEVSGHWHDVDEDTTFNFVYVADPTTYGYFGANVDGDVNALFLLANLWFDVPVGEVIRPYLGGGIGVGRVDADLSMDCPTCTYTGSYSFIDDSDWGFAFQVGGGVAFDIMPNLAVDVGYRFKGINANLDIDGGTTAFFATPTDTDFDYRSHNLLLGIRFMF